MSEVRLAALCAHLLIGGVCGLAPEGVQPTWMKTSAAHASSVFIVLSDRHQGHGCQAVSRMVKAASVTASIAC